MTSIRAMVFSGKAEHLLPGIADSSVDAVITDPPYGLAELPAAVITKALTAWLGGDRMHVPDGKGFMGKDWDKFVPPPGIWDECCRVLKPGGHMAVFAGTRTQDLMGLSIRLAGFEIRDTLHWVYGSGFPKSLDVSKAIDGHLTRGRSDSLSLAQVNAERPGDVTVRQVSQNGWKGFVGGENEGPREKRATPDAARWSGWGTALKPAHEPVILARKPLSEGTVAANVLEHGTGALNVDGCRLPGGKDVPASPRRAAQGSTYGELGNDPATGSGWDPNTGRWPPNLLLVHSADCNDDCAPGCPVAGLDAQGGNSTSRIGKPRKSAIPGDGYGMTHTGTEHDDKGGASRFFPQFTWSPEYDLPFLYQAKAPRSERPRADGLPGHPTVKPLALMRWLTRLVTPPGGLICDPFGGTMTTVQAALAEGFRCVAADSWPDAIAHARVRLAGLQGVVFG